LTTESQKEFWKEVLEEKSFLAFQGIDWKPVCGKMLPYCSVPKIGVQQQDIVM
jgi:hypothetical protein